MRPLLRDPPLAELWQLTTSYSVDRRCYTLHRLADLHEMMDVEDEARRRWDAKREQDR